MEIKESIAYLRPIADSSHLKQYSAALDTAIRCMEEVEELKEERDAWEKVWCKEHNRAVKAEAELRDERDRFDRLTDFELAEAKMLESSLRAVESSGWISVEDRLPENAEEIVLVFVSGRPNHFIRLDQTYELATYNSEDGWILDAYPEWETPGVTHWMPLPDGPWEPARKGGAE